MDSSRSAALFRIGSLVLSAIAPLSAIAVERDEAVVSVSTEQLTLTVNSGRPVGRAIDELRKFGYFITYEDPRYEYQGDLQDVTEQVSRAVTPGNPRSRIIVPKGGIFTIGAPKKDVSAVLDRLLDANAKAGIGGHFKVETIEGTYHVVPTEVRDRDGNLKEQSSILDVPITLEPEERTANDTLRAICRAVEEQTAGARVTAVAELTSIALYQIGAKNEVARSVLLRALKEIQAGQDPMTWLLYYSNSSSQYYLHLRRVVQDPEEQGNPNL